MKSFLQVLDVRSLVVFEAETVVVDLDDSAVLHNRLFHLE